MLCNLPCRIVLLVINTATLIVGIAVLIVGALMTWGRSLVHKLLEQFLTPFLQTFEMDGDPSQISELIDRLMTTTSPLGIFVFAAGASVGILSAIGYVGAYCNLKLVLHLYAAIVGIMAVTIIIIVIIYFSIKSKVGEEVGQLFLQSVKRYQSVEDNTIDSLIVGLIQPQLQCCGFIGPEDFESMKPVDTYGKITFTNLTHPIPCCKMDTLYRIIGEDCPKIFNEMNSNIFTGCRDPIVSLFVKYMDYVAYALIGLSAILSLLVVFTVLTIRLDFA
ncbi:unnamed protein product [Dicrocoelium dendriticum]|nr:unnamed protein product [Dicrocoelium dendriticum]